MIKAAKERINKVSQAARISRQVSQISRNSMDSNYILASSRESSVVNLRKNISGTDSVRSATIRRSGAPARFNWDKRIVRFSHFFSHAKLLVIWPSHRVHRDCKPFNKGSFKYCVTKILNFLDTHLPCNQTLLKKLVLCYNLIIWLTSPTHSSWLRNISKIP